MGRPAILSDAFLVKRRGAEALERAQRRRLGQLVEFARARSPYYRELYGGLPPGVDEPARLPPTGKPELLARFDDWATDREITLERVLAFVGDLDRVGEPFLGRYLAVTSSGTTGVNTFVVVDQRALAVADALRLRALSSWLGVSGFVGLARRGGRTAVVSATHGHFTGAGLTRRRGLRRRAAKALSVLAPIPDLVDELNGFRPAVLSGYASVIGMLAAEQAAGRLRIDPVLVASSAEALTAEEFERVGRAFGARHRSTYAAAECHFVAHGCERGWLHLNADWVMLEPVDADGGPVPPGELSQGALLTNLANRAQPLIRYALDDRVLISPEPCPCGSPLPAMHVEGRSADLITLEGPDGRVGVPPQPMAMLLSGIAGIEAFQLVQTDPSRLRLRLRPAPEADAELAWRTAQEALRGFLAERGLGSVVIERGQESPQQSAGGKTRKFIPLQPGSITSTRSSGNTARPAQ